MPTVLQMGMLFIQLLGAPPSEPDLGQQDLRQKWQELSKDPATYEKFLSQYFMVDVAEETWVGFYKKRALKNKDDSVSKDIKAAGYQAQTAFAEAPWNFKSTLTALVQYWKNVFERPIDAVSQIHSWWMHFLYPLVFSLVVLLLFHLWIWAPAICKDLPKWFGSRSRLLVFVALLTSSLAAAATGLWAEFCFVLLCFTIIYSRNRDPILILACLFALYFNLGSVGSMIVSSISSAAPQEALEKGRTRLMYAPAALEQMAPLERALWSDYNGDLKEATDWAEKVEPPKDRAILIAKLAETKATAHDLLSRFEKLKSEYGDDPVILFNLAQLYIRTQQLILADQMREKLNPNFYAAASAKTSLTNRLLLPPTTRTVWEATGDQILGNFKSLAKRSGFMPFQTGRGLLTLFEVLFPWILIGLAFLKRESASGLCLQTSEPTISPSEPYSNLFLSVSQKKDGTNHAVRQRLDVLTRRSNQLQQSQIRAWTWFFPGSCSLVLDQDLGLSYLKTAIPILFFWNFLSASLQSHVLFIIHLNASPDFALPRVSLGYLFLFLMSYLIFLSQNLSRTNA